MLEIKIPGKEYFDERSQEFIETKECTIQLEHSLVALSKWESKHHKPFLSNKNLTDEDILDYIRCMIISKNVPDEVVKNLTKENVKQITDYIDDPMTATTITNHGPKKPNNEIITSELIYYWMIANQIPVEFQKWHLNRLITLIQVCAAKNTPPKKMGKAATMNQNAALNAQRRAALHSKG